MWSGNEQEDGRVGWKRIRTWVVEPVQAGTVVDICAWQVVPFKERSETMTDVCERLIFRLA